MSTTDMLTKRQTAQRRTAQRQDAQRPDTQRRTNQRRDTRTNQRQETQRPTPQPRDIRPRTNRRDSNYLFTQQQIRSMEKLPDGHRLVSTRYGTPIVRRPDGRLLRVQPNGRFATTISVERVQSYLRLNG